MRKKVKALIMVLILIISIIIVAILIQKDGDQEKGDVSALASEISLGYGNVSINESGKSNQKVIIFEENHASRALQIEIAIMLNRLYDKGYKTVALEGALYTDGELDPSFFHQLNDTTEYYNLKLLTAVQLLKEGEISAAEFLTLAHADAEVWGIENPAEYNVDLSDEAWGSIDSYLIYIALELLTDEEWDHLENLIDENKTDEAWNFICDCVPWINETINKFDNPKQSVEDALDLIQEVEDKADEVNAYIDSETRVYFQELKNYYEVTSERSDTMISKTLPLCKEAEDNLVSLIIGAAHTEKITALLKEKDVTFAVISPNSLDLTEDKSVLNDSCYERKTEGLSVDINETTGYYIDNRIKSHKPPTVLGREWSHTKTGLYLAITLMARDAEDGEIDKAKIVDVLSGYENIKLDMDSIEIDEGEVIFRCIIVLDDQTEKELFIRAAFNREDCKYPSLITSRFSIEELLEDAREEVEEGGNPERNKGELVVDEISPGVVAALSGNNDMIRRTKLRE